MVMTTEEYQTKSLDLLKDIKKLLKGHYSDDASAETLAKE
jgi:hypothetical protein